MYQVGVNAGTSWDWTHKFWEMAYDGAMKDVKHHHGEGGDDSSDSSDSDDSSDDEQEVARGRAAVAALGKVKSKDKGKASSGSPVVHHRDGTVATASAAELKIAAKLAKDPWGRQVARKRNALVIMLKFKPLMNALLPCWCA